MTDKTKDVLIKSYAGVHDFGIDDLKNTIKELSNILLSEKEKKYYDDIINIDDDVEMWELDDGEEEVLLFNKYEIGILSKYVNNNCDIKKVIISKKDINKLPDKK